MRSWLFGCLFAVLFGVVPLASVADPALNLAQYRGKVVYLDFWASWCVPCRKSFPWMNAMQAKYAGQGLVIIGINVDAEAKDAHAFLAHTPANFRIVYDPEGKLAETYGLMGMPSSFVLDRTGKVVATHIGFRDSSPTEYEQQLRELLERQP